MPPKTTIYRLFSSDNTIMTSIGYILNDLFVDVLDLADFLLECTENARLRECLIDRNFQLVLVNLFKRSMGGNLMGRFLSDTGLSIKELENFSPDGFSLSKVYENQPSAEFITFFVNNGTKVTDMGHLIRQSKPNVMRWMASISDDDKDCGFNIYSNYL